jgi:hypothetical protein
MSDGNSDVLASGVTPREKLEKVDLQDKWEESSQEQVGLISSLLLFHRHI